jgi:hypothetical protein
VVASNTQSSDAEFGLIPPSEGFVFSESSTMPQKPAADTGSDAAVLRMLEELTDANKLCNDPTSGPRGAVLAALRAVLDFLHAKQNREGEFSRALDSLYFELQNAGPAESGAILPAAKGAGEAEHDRVKSIRHIKAAAGFALERLHAHGRGMASACSEIEAVLRAQGLTAGKMPVRTIKMWRSRYIRDSAGASPHFLNFADIPIADDNSAEGARHILDWLSNEIDRVTGSDRHPNTGSSPPR